MCLLPRLIWVVGGLFFGLVHGSVLEHRRATLPRVVRPHDDEQKHFAPSVWTDDDSTDDELPNLKGEVKTIEFESKYLGEAREITVYLPPGHDKRRKYPVVYAADGFASVGPELIEALILARKAPPTIIVGVMAGEGDDMRQREYLPGWGDEEAFKAHEKFFIEEVIPWAEQEWGASRERKDRAVYGCSNGGPFVLSMASRHPDLFGNVFAFMVYGMKFDDWDNELKPQPKNPTRFILVAGSDDEAGVTSNERVEEILTEKKFPVDLAVIDGGGHTHELCIEQFPGCIAAAFGNKKYEPIERKKVPIKARAVDAPLLGVRRQPSIRVKQNLKEADNRNGEGYHAFGTSPD